MKTKEFNLELAKAGKKFQTKLGNPARLISVCNNNLMIVAVKGRWTEEAPEKYNLNGVKYHHSPDSLYNLEMVNAYTK